MLRVSSGCVCICSECEALTGRAGPGSDHAGSVRSGCGGWWCAARAQASGGRQPRSSCKPTPRLGHHHEERWDMTREQRHPTNPELQHNNKHILTYSTISQKKNIPSNLLRLISNYMYLKALLLIKLMFSLLEIKNEHLINKCIIIMCVCVYLQCKNTYKYHIHTYKYHLKIKTKK